MQVDRSYQLVRVAAVYLLLLARLGVQQRSVDENVLTFL